jgi:DNA-binding GntR family transcriptional regulator
MPSFSWRTDRGTRNSLKLERPVHIVNININNLFDNLVARPVFPAIILFQMTVKTSPDVNGKIVRDLEEDIVFGVFHPKERLTEEDLMARFGLKRHVVRDALSELDSIGLVVRVPNRGAYVRELTPEEVIEIYEVREILEVAAAMRTPLPAPKEVVDVTKKIQGQHSEAVERHDLRRVFRLNIQFHREQFLACGNNKLVQSIAKRNS